MRAITHVHPGLTRLRREYESHRCLLLAMWPTELICAHHHLHSVWILETASDDQNQNLMHSCYYRLAHFGLRKEAPKLPVYLLCTAFG